MATNILLEDVFDAALCEYARARGVSLQGGGKCFNDVPKQEQRGTVSGAMANMGRESKLALWVTANVSTASNPSKKPHFRLGGVRSAMRLKHAQDGVKAMIDWICFMVPERDAQHAYA